MKRGRQGGGNHGPPALKPAATQHYCCAYVFAAAATFLNMADDLQKCGPQLSDGRGHGVSSVTPGDESAFFFFFFKGGFFCHNLVPQNVADTRTRRLDFSILKGRWKNSAHTWLACTGLVTIIKIKLKKREIIFIN